MLKGAEILLRRHKLVLVNDTAETITAQNASVMAWRRRGNRPSYVHEHSGFRERVLAIRDGEKHPMIAESDVNAVLPALCIGPMRVCRPAPASRTPVRAWSERP